MVRDNDGAYGHVFRSRVRAMGIRDRPISPGSPWQNAYVERLIGTVRRECRDRMLIFGESLCVLKTRFGNSGDEGRRARGERRCGTRCVGREGSERVLL